jgi:hypothetical protein
MTGPSHVVLGALRPDHACQFVIDTHDYAYGLACAESRAGRRANSGSADLGPRRPAPSVIHVSVKGVVDRDHPTDKLGELGGWPRFSSPETLPQNRLPHASWFSKRGHSCCRRREIFSAVPVRCCLFHRADGESRTIPQIYFPQCSHNRD